MRNLQKRFKNSEKLRAVSKPINLYYTVAMLQLHNVVVLILQLSKQASILPYLKRLKIRNTMTRTNYYS